MATYIGIPVEAEQFHIGDVPKILFDKDGRALTDFRGAKHKETGIFNELMLIRDDGQTIDVDPGDWIVRVNTDTFYVYTHDEFVAEYTRVVA